MFVLYFHFTSSASSKSNIIVMSFDGSSFANLLECPVCYEQFKTPPKQLPCKHTLCESCLHGLVKYNMIACPECREVSQVPTGGVAAFPNDLTMQRFLEHHRTRALQSSHLPQHRQTTAVQQSPVKISGDSGDMAAQLDLQRNLQGALLLMERDKEVRVQFKNRHGLSAFHPIFPQKSSSEKSKIRAKCIDGATFFW